MSYLQSIVLGIIQGLTEFLPISSSGHLALLQNLFGLEDQSTQIFFDVLLHVVTLLAIIMIYYKKIWKLLVCLIEMIIDIFRKEKKADADDMRFVFFIVIATLPLFIAAPFKDHIEGFFGNILVIGIALLVTATLLLLSDRVKDTPKTLNEARFTDILIVGIAQTIALIPGLSRSGTTISTGVFRGLTRETAVEFSFILAIPAILGATILQIRDVMRDGFPAEQLPIYLTGCAFAFVFALAAIQLVKLLAKKGAFKYFAVYCYIVGVIAIASTFFG